MSIVELLTQKEFIVALIIFGLMSAAIKWLIGELRSAQAELAVANKDRFDLRDQRAGDLEKRGDEYHQFGESSREVQRSWEQRMQLWESKIDTVIASLRGDRV